MSPPSATRELLFIDGALTAASSGETFPNVNPATEEIIGVTADATGADLDRAITAARPPPGSSTSSSPPGTRSASSWPRTPGWT
jgi:aldehyde dehydrogenase (NAD+)